MDLPRAFTIRESSHRILDPLSPEKLAVLGRALFLQPGTAMLDLASGKGEMLNTWSRDHGITGTGVDISSVFTEVARARAAELGVADRVSYIHADASTYRTHTPVDVASCCGATWIGGGVAGTIELLERSLRPGGMVLIGEPYWRRKPPDEETVRGCHADHRDDFRSLLDLVEHVGELGWDLVEMVISSQEDWDRYTAAQWLNLRRFLDGNREDELYDEIRANSPQHRSSTSPTSASISAGESSS